jgi:hypothetical protein
MSRRNSSSQVINSVELSSYINSQSQQNVFYEEAVPSKPKYLWTDDPLRDKMQERANFADFVFKNALDDLIIRQLFGRTLEEDMKDIPNFIHWIGGSQAWRMWYNRHNIDARRLTNIEKSSVTAGNFDVFFACNDRKNCQLLIQNLFMMTMKLKNELQILKLGYSLTVEVYGAAQVETLNKKTLDDFRPVTQTLDAPAFSIMAILKGSNKSMPFHDKLLLYCEVAHLQDVNLHQFSKYYLMTNDGDLSSLVTLGRVNTLNDIGLLTMSLWITQPRITKGFDIDKIRQDLFFKTMKESQKAWLEDAHKLYVEIFKNTKCYLSYVTDRITLDIMRATPEVDEIINTFHVDIVERLRPSINAFIEETSKTLKQSNAHMFIVGGDAIKRYTDSREVTNDIDTKVCIKKGMRENNIQKIKDIIEHDISKLTVYLVQNKNRLLEGVKGQNINVRTSYTDIKSKVSIYPLIDSPQFRVRVIKQSEAFPVNLFSIDYRAKIKYSFPYQQATINYDIPILDVVIQKVDSIEDHFIEKAGTIPVASLGFLLKDLETTYEDKLNALRRISRNKQKKNSDRYISLRVAKQVSISTPKYLEDLNKVDESYKSYNRAIVNNYLAELKSLNKPGIFKYKTRFTFFPGEMIDMQVQSTSGIVSRELRKRKPGTVSVVPLPTKAKSKKTKPPLVTSETAISQTIPISHSPVIVPIQSKSRRNSNAIMQNIA